MKNLFIDANIYLAFYEFSNADLEELHKLSASVKAGQINLIVTKQIENEYRRNREPQIAKAIKIFSEQGVPNKFPNICKGYEEEYTRIRELLKAYAELKMTLLQKIDKDVSAGECGADKLINQLFDVGKVQDIKDAIIDSAKTRVELGNPPGKKGSLGDAINWEFLLENVPVSENLYMISEDGDFASQLQPNNLAEFLSREWNTKKNSKVFYYHRLSDFLNVHLAEIKITSDQEKEEKEMYISMFIVSPNFALTHTAIKGLSNQTVFSDSELNVMIDASKTNPQIYLIKEDSDVRSFLNKLDELKAIHNLPF